MILTSVSEVWIDEPGCTGHTVVVLASGSITPSTHGTTTVISMEFKRWVKHLWTRYLEAFVVGKMISKTNDYWDGGWDRRVREKMHQLLAMEVLPVIPNSLGIPVDIKKPKIIPAPAIVDATILMFEREAQNKASMISSVLDL